jgi:hypothetical protein
MTLNLTKDYNPRLAKLKGHIDLRVFLQKNSKLKDNKI